MWKKNFTQPRVNDKKDKVHQNSKISTIEDNARGAFETKGLVTFMNSFKKNGVKAQPLPFEIQMVKSKSQGILPEL